MLRRPLVLLALLMCIAVAGCGDENPVIEERSPLDDMVITNCYTVQRAAEAYAAANGGRYPRSELIAYLPQGTRLENPYTNFVNVPLYGTAVSPGETGYRTYAEANGVGVGYLITGFGADGELIRLSNLPQDVFYFEEQTIANCYTVLDAVEAFAADNNGIYPSSVNDITSSGQTVTDFLPGGHLLTNPYTLAATEPVPGWAASPGQTGYSPITGGGLTVGCMISGYGRYWEIILLGPLSWQDQDVKTNAYNVWKAVEDFAAENNGGYPNDVDTDVSLSGNTVINLLRNGQRRWNPYTEQRTEPRNGLVTTRGQVGYLPVSNGSANEGYIINGWGLFEEVVRLEK